MRQEYVRKSDLVGVEEARRWQVRSFVRVHALRRKLLSLERQGPLLLGRGEVKQDKRGGAGGPHDLVLPGIERERRQHIHRPVAPVAYQVILESRIGQFRDFESPRVHTRINSWGFFRCAQIDLRKARQRELATLDEKSTSSGIAEPYAR